MKRKIFILLSAFFLLFHNGYAQHTIEDRDTTEWIPLKDGEVREPYKRIGNQIYPFQNNCMERRRLKNVDIETFRVHINACYAKDKNTLYYISGICCGCGEDYVRDWVCGLCWRDGRNVCSFCFEGPIVPNVNPNTFTVLNRGEKGNYGTDGSNVYYGGVIIRGADIHSFEILDKSYSKDKNAVFYGDNKVEGADVKSFRVFNDENFKWGAADKNHLYRMGEKFTDANPNTVRFFPADYIADDKDVYLNGRLIEGFDGKTFEVLRGGFIPIINDKNGAYINHRKIEGSDGETFQYISHGYSKDKNYVYRHNNIVEGVNPDGFQVLSDFFQKNKKHVFYRMRIIENADPETFQLVEIDKVTENDYWRGAFAKDKNHVFNHSRIVEGADAETFEQVDGQSVWKDKNYFYYASGTIIQIKEKR